MRVTAMTTTTVDLILALLLCSKVTSLSVQNHDFNSIVVEADDTDYEEIRYHQNQTLERIMISKSKVVNITCPELNNVTFTNQPPFDILGIPQCWNKIEPELRLYLNDANKTECELEVRQLPNANTTRCFELLKRHSEAKKVVIVTHGFLNNFDTRWLHTMKDAIQEVEPGTAVIILGWGRGLVEIFTYHTAAANTRYVSEAVFQLVRNMHSVVGRDLYVHCAGHSLGAHVCGLTGKLLQTSGTKMFDRISAMDPAGPLFFNDVPYPWNGLNVSSASRLNRTDAKLVDVIHTDGDARYLGYIPQYGTLESAGTADFYPGTGKGAYGCYQPGCYDVFDVVACSHSRAHEYYMASIKEAACLASRHCVGDPKTYPSHCTNILNNTTQYTQVTMGYWWPRANTAPGCYTVEITSTLPYCKPIE